MGWSLCVQVILSSTGSFPHMSWVSPLLLLDRIVFVVAHRMAVQILVRFPDRIRPLELNIKLYTLAPCNSSSFPPHHVGSSPRAPVLESLLMLRSAGVVGSGVRYAVRMLRSSLLQLSGCHPLLQMLWAALLVLK